MVAISIISVKNGILEFYYVDVTRFTENRALLSEAVGRLNQPLALAYDVALGGGP